LGGSAASNRSEQAPATLATRLALRAEAQPDSAGPQTLAQAVSMAKAAQLAKRPYAVAPAIIASSPVAIAA
jgi:hypothetical protein